MKFLVHCIAVLPLVGTLAACAPKNDAKTEVVPSRVGIANPASEYCVKKGGKLEIRKNSEGGEYGICHLADGTQIEEWELFRRDNAAGTN
ncbi:hypothetical protein ABB27_13695 [Stenotrophomonas terrae]|uniref:Hemolysin n=1 Tax=Stenotrophomonas terrae TaxID=405446 RepID=A0A0R0C9Y4_9GAMM|nr:DUF333 domain-containing protein [Stenotrophomonas terrae]KRG66429.1 hypothetical protein ABB27_13695 [Stenotrophomonas terrae]